MAEQQHELVVVATPGETHVTYRSTDGASMGSIATLILDQTAGRTSGGLVTFAADLRNALEPLDTLSEAASETSEPAAAAAAPVPAEAAAPSPTAAAAPVPAVTAVQALQAPLPLAVQSHAAAARRAQEECEALIRSTSKARRTAQSTIPWAFNKRINGRIIRGAGWPFDDDVYFESWKSGEIYNTLTERAPLACHTCGDPKHDGHWQIRCSQGENRQLYDV
jgi:hypothetical protein